MSFSGRKSLWLATGLGFGVLFSIPLPAQLATNGTPVAPPARSAADLPPLPPPTLKSPVDLFRELLAMPLLERKQALTNRPPEAQKRILAKLREYQSLKPNERELRLRATELRWYLLPLMNMPRTNRQAQLARIPEEDRKLVEERLTRWDLLPPELQMELLNNDLAARYFSQVETATEEQKQKILGQMSPDRLAKLEAGMNHWRSLTEEQREAALAGFNSFFELNPRERAKALNTLSETERQQMERTLQAYSKLSLAQRRQCIHSFEKFASMSVEDRQMFLKNAERWKLMSPAERETWRKLVELAPILPPTPQARPVLPLMPSSLRRPAATVATN
jgi:hypothetical protein